MIKVVLFDLDDTLISEYDYIKSGYRHIAGILSSQLKTPAETLYKALLTLFHEERRNVFNRLFDAYGIKYTQGDILTLVSAYREHNPEISFYGDIPPTIHALKERGIHTGIITDGYVVTQRRKLAAVNAEAYFDHILLTDELGREYWKPSPRAFELMQAHFSVTFDEMMYVGDNPEKDFYIGSLYPITTVRIRRDDGIYRSAKYFRGVRELEQVKNLWELEALV